MKRPSGLEKAKRLMRRSEASAEPSRDVDDIWADAAERTGGRLVEQGRRPEIHVPHGPWTIIVDKEIVNTGSSIVVYTRTRSYLLARDDFSFHLFKRTFWSRFVWIYRMPDVSVGDRELEEKYVVRSAHASRVRSLLHERELRELVMAQPSMRFTLKGLSWWRRRKVGSRVRVLTVRTTGVVTEVERLVDFIHLIQTGLDQLTRIGSADKAPVLDDRHNGELRRRL